MFFLYVCSDDQKKQMDDVSKQKIVTRVKGDRNIVVGAKKDGEFEFETKEAFRHCSLSHVFANTVTR